MTYMWKSGQTTSWVKSAFAAPASAHDPASSFPFPLVQNHSPSARPPSGAFRKAAFQLTFRPPKRWCNNCTIRFTHIGARSISVWRHLGASPHLSSHEKVRGRSQQGCWRSVYATAQRRVHWYLARPRQRFDSRGGGGRTIHSAAGPNSELARRQWAAGAQGRRRRPDAREAKSPKRGPEHALHALDRIQRARMASADSGGGGAVEARPESRRSRVWAVSPARQWRVTGGVVGFGVHWRDGSRSRHHFLHGRSRQRRL